MRVPGFEPGSRAWEEAILEEFRKFALNLYSEEHARNLYFYLRKLGLKIVLNPSNAIELSKLRPRPAKQTLISISAFLKFLKLRGIEIDLDLNFIKQFAKKEQPKIDIFEYEERGDVIKQALSMVKKNLGPKKKIFTQVAFFTGLRASEIRFLFKNWERLRKKEIEKCMVVELNYLRRTKNAYLTIMPTALAEQIYPIDFGKNIARKLTYKGIKVMLFRKAHTAILSRTMMPHEIDLLQGRLNSILVRHYVKHLREIAKKYWEAYGDYIILLTLS